MTRSNLQGVFVSAPFSGFRRAAAAHAALVSVGVAPTSTPWVEHAQSLNGCEPIAPTRAQALDLWRRNSLGICDSFALIALAEPGAGGEMFREVGFALDLFVPVVWVGERVILSTLALERPAAWVLDEAAAGNGRLASTVVRLASLGDAAMFCRRLGEAMGAIEAPPATLRSAVST